MRAASAHDREALGALWRALDELHVSIVPSFFGWAEDRSELAMRRALADPNEMVLVAEDGRGVVRGLSHVVLYDTPPGGGRTPARRAHLDSLVVDPAVRRRGCGRALVEASRRWARGKGAVQLVLTVWDGNAEAERFYGALGFRAVSRVLGVEL